MGDLSLAAIADMIGAKLKGDPHHQVTGIATLASAKRNEVSFLANMKYVSQLGSTKAGAVILNEQQAELYDGNCLILDNPYLGYAKLTQQFNVTSHLKGIDAHCYLHESAVIGKDVNLGAGVVIGPGVVIGDRVTIGPNTSVGADCVIGDQTHIAANVSLYHGVSVGKGCIIHSGAVLGADGFGFAKDGSEWVKIAQLGRVRVGDDVEVGAGTTIDRGALDDTIIGTGVKLDNQVQIAHNVEIGDYTAIAGCTAIAGSTKIGKHCTIAGACGITGHLTLVDGVHVTAMSLVTHSVKEAGAYSSGTGFDTNQKWRRNAARFKQLDQMAKRLKQLELKLAQMQE